MNWSTQTIDHQARIQLGLSMNDYVCLDYIYRTQTSPLYGGKINGWCDTPLSKIGEFLGLSKGALSSIFKKMAEKKLLEIDGNKRKTTKKWWVIYENDSVQKVNDSKRQRSESERQRSESERDTYNIKEEIKEEALPPKKAASSPSKNSSLPSTKENQKQALIKFLETGIKNNTLLAMCEGIDLTLPEIRQKFADYWFGLERSFTGSTGDKNYVKNSMAKWLESETVNFKNTKEKTGIRFDDKMEKVIEIFMCYSPRIPSKERRESAFAIARKLFKDGVTLEDLDIQMSKVQFLGIDFKDVDNFLQRWEKVVKIRPESWEQEYGIIGNSKPVTKYQRKYGSA